MLNLRLQGDSNEGTAGQSCHQLVTQHSVYRSAVSCVGMRCRAMQAEHCCSHDWQMSTKGSPALSPVSARTNERQLLLVQSLQNDCGCSLGSPSIQGHAYT
eukprot:TRINITY_DN2903_c0_g3_i1.p2 TRINITY_DN2903_c0_g3~~TRINITY_DN2903_c0_g3_i1.p2  ORF type:complete len:101 (+),score=1.92 TRINITY_DN2903_c0_g3_i1:248-550(+)